MALCCRREGTIYCNQDIKNALPLIMPALREWCLHEERVILNAGAPLMDYETLDARLAGVRQPERLRLLQVDHLRLTSIGLLRRVLPALEIVRPTSVAMTLGYGIYICKSSRHNREVLVHHFVHAAQSERLGGIDHYISTYIQQCLEYGYNAAPLELEAREMTLQILTNTPLTAINYQV